MKEPIFKKRKRIEKIQVKIYLEKEKFKKFKFILKEHEFKQCDVMEELINWFIERYEE